MTSSFVINSASNNPLAPQLSLSDVVNDSLWSKFVSKLPEPNQRMFLMHVNKQRRKQFDRICTRNLKMEQREIKRLWRRLQGLANEKKEMVDVEEDDDNDDDNGDNNAVPVESEEMGVKKMDNNSAAQRSASASSSSTSITTATVTMPSSSFADMK